jgi:hypothetical protein
VEGPEGVGGVAAEVAMSKNGPSERLPSLPASSTTPIDPQLLQLLDSFKAGLGHMSAGIDKYAGRPSHKNCPHCGERITR